MQQVMEISSLDSWKEQTKKNIVSVSFFYADMDLSSMDANGKNDWKAQVDVIFTQLATLHPRLKFLKIHAEKAADLSDHFQISVVPTFILAQGHSLLEKLEGMKLAELAKRVDLLSKSKETTTAAAKDVSTGSEVRIIFIFKQLIDIEKFIQFNCEIINLRQDLMKHLFTA